MQIINSGCVYFPLAKVSPASTMCEVFFFFEVILRFFEDYGFNELLCHIPDLSGTLGMTLKSREGAC